MSDGEAAPGARRLVRRLGLFDATMIVMGGIVGAGIFVNPAEVARHVTTPGLIVGAWAIGGATLWNNPANSAVGFLILLAGVPICLFWLRRRRREAAR